MLLMMTLRLLLLLLIIAVSFGKETSYDVGTMVFIVVELQQCLILTLSSCNRTSDAVVVADFSADVASVVTAVVTAAYYCC